MQDLIDNVYNFNKNVFKTIKKFHVFYEWQITENSVLKLFESELDILGIKQNILNIVNINISDKATNNVANLYKFLKRNNFKYFCNGIQIKIRKGDFVFFINDFDIYHDYEDGANLDNTNRIFGERNSFLINYKKLFNYFSKQEVIFNVLPNFPSIEYAIMLGCLEIEELNELALETKLDVLRIISQKTNVFVALKTKDFSKVYESNKFSYINMIENSLKDRVFKKMPQSIINFNEIIFKNGLEEYVINREKPFSYIDGIIEHINNLFVDLRK